LLTSRIDAAPKVAIRDPLDEVVYHESAWFQVFRTRILRVGGQNP
jgi:hypothetical protein